MSHICMSLNNNVETLFYGIAFILPNYIGGLNFGPKNARSAAGQFSNKISACKV